MITAASPMISASVVANQISPSSEIWAPRAVAAYDARHRTSVFGERTPMTTQSAGLSTNLVGVLCYLFGIVGGVAFLLLASYNQDTEVRFHALQSIFLTIAWVVFWVGLGIVASIGPLGVLWFLTPLISLAAFVLWIYLMVKTYQGQRVTVPVVGELAAQQA
jgi:uncharacterized membrane protein